MWYFLTYKLKTIIIIVLLLLVLGFYFYPESTNNFIGYAVANAKPKTFGLLGFLKELAERILQAAPKP